MATWLARLVLLWYEEVLFFGKEMILSVKVILKILVLLCGTVCNRRSPAHHGNSLTIIHPMPTALANGLIDCLKDYGEDYLPGYLLYFSRFCRVVSVLIAGMPG